MPYSHRRRVELRKPYHPPSTLDALTEKQEAQVMGWFLEENITYLGACVRIKQRFRLQVSANTISNFWHTYCAPVIAERSRQTGRVVKLYKSQGWLDHLSVEQAEQLKSWFVKDNISYREASARILAMSGKKVSHVALAGYWRRICAPLTLPQPTEKIAVCEGVELKLTVHPDGRVSGKMPVPVKKNTGDGK